VAVPTAKALPYGIVVGQDGAVYFCEFGTNQIGRLDPGRMDIRELGLPDQDARPRRLALGRDHALYYTDFARGYLGRLDPQTGTSEEWPSPGGARSQPYAIATTSDGIVWFVETGLRPNMLVRFDPDTRLTDRWPIPSGGGVVRNMVAVGADRLYLSESGVDKVAIANVR
jgi:virginiamycin B lyase